MDVGLPGETPDGFSSAKRALLLELKRRPNTSLADLAKGLGISRVAVLRHLSTLESQHLVERSYRPGRVGRPRAIFRLTGSAAGLFPEAYTQMSLSALGFIEERLGRNAVVQMLQQRGHEVFEDKAARIDERSLPGRVGQLAQIRTEGGYMAELGARQGATVEMLEHNCPILAIAGKYPEACDVERRLFESLLKAKVDVSHRVVAGDPVCRFLMRAKEGRR